MDVHQASIVVAVMNAAGKLMMESAIETKAATILEFIKGLRGTPSMVFEEVSSAAWLYDLLKSHVERVTESMRASSPICCARASVAGLSRRMWSAHSARTVAQLPDRQQGSDAHQESSCRPESLFMRCGIEPSAREGIEGRGSCLSNDSRGQRDRHRLYA